jgi:hypothetical protein
VPAAVRTDVPTVVAACLQQPYKNMNEYLDWARRILGNASLSVGQNSKLCAAEHVAAP